MIPAWMVTAALWAAAQLPPAAQAPVRVQTGVHPETVRIGDRFRSVVRLRPLDGAVAGLEPLRIVDPVQQVDSLRLTRAADGSVTASYTLVAWVVSDSLSVDIPLRVTLAGDSATYRVALRLPVVASVLPRDSSAIEPRPARPMLPIPGERPRRSLIWALAVAALLGLAALALLRRRAPRVRAEAAVDPRAEALRRLQQLDASGLLERGETGAYYVVASRVLRELLAAVDAGLGEHLSSEELMEVWERDGRTVDGTEALRALLTEADRAKFAGARPDVRSARAFGAGVAAWISAFEPSRPPAEAGVAT